jgi:hypothetical protein
MPYAPYDVSQDTAEAQQSTGESQGRSPPYRILSPGEPGRVW